jgi:hypothetical protein
MASDSMGPAPVVTLNDCAAWLQCPKIAHFFVVFSSVDFYESTCIRNMFARSRFLPFLVLQRVVKRWD